MDSTSADFLFRHQVRISSKGYKEKTKTAKKDLAPTWNDIFYMYVPGLKGKNLI